MERGLGVKFMWLHSSCCQPGLLWPLLTASRRELCLVHVCVPHGTIPGKPAPADVTGVWTDSGVLHIICLPVATINAFKFHCLKNNTRPRFLSPIITRVSSINQTLTSSALCQGFRMNHLILFSQKPQSQSVRTITIAARIFFFYYSKNWTLNWITF